VATAFDLAAFAAELDVLRAEPEASRWHIERDNSVPLGVLVGMYPASAPEEQFLARFRWDQLTDPASLKFLNLKSRSDTDRTAWPKCPGFRPGNLDACVSWTKEGHALHPDWRTTDKASFESPPNPVAFVVAHLQHLLDAHYGGRGP